MPLHIDDAVLLAAPSSTPAPIFHCGADRSCRRRRSNSVEEGVLPHWIIAILALAASLFPAVADALNFETSIDEIARTAAEYKVLQDRFRFAANLTAQEDVNEAQRVLTELMDRMDVVRSTSLTPPERYFKEAQTKINQGTTRSKSTAK